MRHRNAAAVGAVLLAVVGAALLFSRPGNNAPGGAGARGDERWFAADSVWNARVPRDAPVAADSAAVVANLARQAAAGAYFNTDRYSVPVVIVPGSQPTVRVHDRDDGFMSQVDSPYGWGEVPLPSTARPSAGTDGHLVIWQPSTDTMWEFWGFRDGADGPSALHGARIPHVSTSPGWLPSPYGATASGLPLVAGLVTADDMAHGRIDHALALGIPRPRARVFVAPATRTDGADPQASAPAEGQRFRLDPSVEVDALGLSPFVAMLAHAAQDHGVIVRDTAGVVVMYGEDPTALAVDPFAAALSGADRTALMRSFPWGRLQLLSPPG